MALDGLSRHPVLAPDLPPRWPPLTPCRAARPIPHQARIVARHQKRKLQGQIVSPDGTRACRARRRIFLGPAIRLAVIVPDLGPSGPHAQINPKRHSPFRIRSVKKQSSQLSHISHLGMKLLFHSRNYRNLLLRLQWLFLLL